MPTTNAARALWDTMATNTLSTCWLDCCAPMARPSTNECTEKARLHVATAHNLVDVVPCGESATCRSTASSRPPSVGGARAAARAGPAAADAEIPPVLAPAASASPARRSCPFIPAASREASRSVRSLQVVVVQLGWKLNPPSEADPPEKCLLLEKGVGPGKNDASGRGEALMSACGLASSGMDRREICWATTSVTTMAMKLLPAAMHRACEISGAAARESGSKCVRAAAKIAPAENIFARNVIFSDLRIRRDKSCGNQMPPTAVRRSTSANPILTCATVSIVPAQFVPSTTYCPTATSHVGSTGGSPGTAPNRIGSVCLSSAIQLSR
mmetsp:Transcript_50146/g.95790  ORF Transcript_50146/g.95790 Transcript_50146/m.95790 type:complete len:328 (+) Transcript_50146:599-1582(+)